VNLRLKSIWSHVSSDGTLSDATSLPEIEIIGSVLAKQNQLTADTLLIKTVTN